MESDARPPEKLSNVGSMPQNWKRWKKMFLNYMKLTGGINKPEDQKVAWLRNLIGQVGLEALETISFENPEDEDNLTIVLEKLDSIFDPPKNEVEESYKFFTRSKKNNESIDDYVDSLRVLAKFCNFGDRMERFVRDAVVLDIKDKNLRKLIFQQGDMDLEKLKIVYKTYEVNMEKMKEESKESIPEKPNTNFRKQYGTPGPHVPRSASATREPKNACWRCGERHAQRECPAWNNFCCYCNQKHHYSHQCPVAKLDGRKLTAPPIPPKNNFSSPFRIEKNPKVQVGDKNNLSSVAGADKAKNYMKHETVQSDPVLKDFEFVESGNPKKVQNIDSKVQNKLSTCNDLGKPLATPRITSPQPLSQTTTGNNPSAPSASLLDLNVQRPRPVPESFPGKQEFQTNKNKTVESSGKQQQNYYHRPPPQTDQPRPREFRKQAEKPKQKPDSECLIS